MCDAGVINGFSNGTFQPNSNVTYGQALKLIMLAAGYPAQEKTGTHWASGYLTKAKADKLIQNAEYLKQKRINEAVEQVAMFNAMYEEYEQNPGITKSRMYYEAISQVLPGVKLYVNTGDGGNLQTLLPLEPMTSVDGGQ